MPTTNYKIACFASSTESSCCTSDAYHAQCYDPYCSDCVVDAGSSTGYGGVFPRSCTSGANCLGCVSGGTTCPGECKCHPGSGCGCYTPGTYNPIACTGGTTTIPCDNTCGLYAGNGASITTVCSGSSCSAYGNISIRSLNTTCPTTGLEAGNFEVDILCDGVPFMTWTYLSGLSLSHSGSNMILSMSTRFLGNCPPCGINGLSYGVKLGICPGYIASGSVTNNCYIT